MRSTEHLPESSKVINIASVPDLSLFRYPGGKTWLVPRVLRWLTGLSDRPAEFIEPFAGGGIVSLTIADQRLVDRVTMVELDSEIAAVWQTILTGDGLWLADQIAAFNLTDNTVAAVLLDPNPSLRDIAFRTILKNRINRGGIIAPGAGKLKRGENGKGILSRWYPRTLRRRILHISEMRDRIRFAQGDGLETLRHNANRSDVAYFIDPPYTASSVRTGSRLYTHFEIDHAELFRVASTLAGNFLITYDDSDEVRAFAQQYNFDIEAVPMKNTHHYRKLELLIGRDLGWART